MNNLFSRLSQRADVPLDPTGFPKVSIIGASGKVARVTIETLFKMNTGLLNLALISRSPDRVEGIVLDARSTMSLPLQCQGKPPVLPRYDVTDNLDAVRDSKLVIVTAGSFLSVAEAEIFRKTDPTGRLSQAYANYNMICDLTEKVGSLAPEALMIVVTNQSDMMAAVAREHHPDPARVLGFGGMIDSARFRDHAKQLAMAKNPRALCPEIEGQMIGYHNMTQILLSSSFSHKVAFTEAETEQLVQDTRVTGARIAKLQRRADYVSSETGAKLDTGASIMPGTALALCALAVAGQGRMLIESFNTLLCSDTHADHYGVGIVTALSVPIELGPDGYSVSTDFMPTEQEKVALREAVRNMNADCKALRAVVKRPACV